MPAGGLPFPDLHPQSPQSPFTYDVLWSAVLHLLGQAAVFGSLAVLLDIGILQLLRSFTARWHAVAQSKGLDHKYRRLALQDSQLPCAAPITREAPVEGVEGGDEDVVAEKEAVLAGDGLTAAAVSSG